MSACFICNRYLDDGTAVTVKERGVRTLLLASIKREEKEHELLLTNLKSISVHKACQKKYADERATAVVVRRRQSSTLSQSPAPSQPLAPSQPPASSQLPAPSQPPDVEKFDFTNRCFICADTIPIDFEARNMKKPVHYRESIHTVKQFSSLKNTIFKRLENRSDEASRKLAERIGDVSDADAAGARYHSNCMQRLYNAPPTGRKRGRPGVDEAMETIYAFIFENDEGPLKLSQLVNLIERDKQPDLRTVKSHLQQKYGEDICIFDCKGHDAFVFLKSSGYKILSSTWFGKKKPGNEKQKLRVVREAAAIILEDILSKCDDIDTHPASDDVMSEVDVAVPKSLRVLLTEVIAKSKQGSSKDWKKKRTSIAHSIITAVRPRADEIDEEFTFDLSLLHETEAEDGEQGDECLPSSSKQSKLAQ